MPNDLLVRQHYFTTLVNSSFPNLKAAHDCELSKLSIEDIKEGAKIAQVGLGDMCMGLGIASMVGGPPVSVLAAMCETVYAGFSLWALDESITQTNDLTNCLTIGAGEMCGKEGESLDGAITDLGVASEDAKWILALPLELVGAYSDVLYLAKGFPPNSKFSKIFKEDLAKAKKRETITDPIEREKRSIKPIHARIFKSIWKT